MPLAYEPVQQISRGPRTFVWIKHFFMDRLTGPGRVLFAVGVVVTAASAITLAAKMYFVFCALASLALLSLPLARMARVPLSVDLELPSRGTCGAVMRVPLYLQNSSKRTAVDIGFALDGLPDQLTSEPLATTPLKPGESRELIFVVEMKRRGYYQVRGVRQETWFPFGVWRDLYLHKQPQTLLVYPRFSPLVSLDMPVGLRYQPGGVALSSNVGDSTEFLGVRDFRPGDSIRNIHWKSWGRVGAPVVKEFQEEFFCKIALVLDTFLPQGSAETYRDDFEGVLSIAAAIADHLSHTEYIVDLFAAGPDLYTLEAGRNLAHLDNVLDVLACLEPSYEKPFESVAPVLTEHLSTITTVVFIMLDWDENRERMARVVRDHGPAVKTIMVRQSAPTLDPAGAEQPIVSLTPAQVAQGVQEL
ncbi:MAG: DUF58 domain-containing protein [Vulcanimicrobiota bacterium]